MSTAQSKELLIFSIGVQGLMGVRGLSAFALSDEDAARMITWLFKSSDGTPGQRWYIGSVAKDDVSRRCIYRHGGDMFGCSITTAEVPEPVMQCFVDIANLWWNYGQPTAEPMTQTFNQPTVPQRSIPAEQPETLKEATVDQPPVKATYGDIWPRVKDKIAGGEKSGTVPCTCGGQVTWSHTYEWQGGPSLTKMRCPSCGFNIAS